MKVTADRITLDRTSGKIATELSVRRADACQVLMEIDEDGNVIDGPRCVSVSCTGSCELRQEKDGSNVSYWCDCDS